MTNDYTECLAVALQELRLARTLLQREISDYPGPIAGCDAQFNHLLGERQKVHEALAALEAGAFVPTPRQLHPRARVESR